MRTRGVDVRAKEARAAVNRLRWEIDLAVGVWGNHPATAAGYGAAVGAVNEIAELIGILRNALDAIDEHVPAEHRTSILNGEDVRDRLARLIERYVDYHRVGR
jgi:hypothetical protein